MKNWILFFALLFAVPVFAQSDPLNSAYLPSIDTTCADYPANVAVTNDLVTIYRDVGSLPTCSNGALFGSWGTIYAVQNEFADFQVFIHDTGSGTTGYQVTVSSFQCTTGPNCGTTQTIAAPDSSHTDIIPYLEMYVNDAVTSGVAKTGTLSYLNIFLTQGAGHVPDPLVPAIDPYFHQTTNAFPLNISANQTQGVWIDIHVPTTAPSGYYKGTVTLQSGCTGPYPSTGCSTITALPIILGVWQWPSAGFMPSTSSLFSVNGIGDSTACDGFFGGTGFPGSACANGWPAPGGNINTAITLLKEQSTVLYLDHRIQQSAPYIVGPPWTNFDQYFKPLLNGTTVSGTGVANTILPGAAMVNMQFNGNGGTLQDWMTHFQANGWGNRIDNYYCDEPPTGCAPGGAAADYLAGWRNVWQRAGTLHALTPSMALQTTTSFLRLASGNGSGQSEATMCSNGFAGATGGGVASQPATCLDNSIDWMVPNVVDYANGEYSNLSAYTTWVAGASNIGTAPLAPRRYGSYWACDSTACGSQHSAPGTYYLENVNINLDTTAISHRATAWFMGFTGATGDLYFANDICWAGSGSTCTDGTTGSGGDPFAGVAYNGSQGDGTLVYPGRTTGNPSGKPYNAGVTTPIFLPSMRLKHWRDAHQDYEYFVVLRAHGQGALVSSAFSSWMNTTPGGTGVLAWSFNNTQAPAGTFTSDLPDQRQILGAAIHALTYGGTSSAVTPTFSPVGGTYGSTQSVTISTISAGAIICYNTTGSPATNGASGCTTGTLYSGPVSVAVSQTLFAVAGGTGFTDSAVGFANYTISGPVTLSTGIINSQRQIDWTNAGIPGVAGGGPLPSAGWPICSLSSTITPSSTVAAVISAMANCRSSNPTGSVLLLPSGTMTFTSSLQFPAGGMIALRGAGANSTFITFTGFGGNGCNTGHSAYIGMCGSDQHNQYSTPIPAVYNWTAGYTQGTANPVISVNPNPVGTIHAGTSTTPPTFLFLNQCNTGLTGATCGPSFGANLDNGQLFVCAEPYTAPYNAAYQYITSNPDQVTFTGSVYDRIPPNGPPTTGIDPTDATKWGNLGSALGNTILGCGNENQVQGPKGSLIRRWQYEIAVPTVVTPTSITLQAPLQDPNFASGLSPQLWITQPTMQMGIENLSIDSGAETTAGGPSASPFIAANSYTAGQVVNYNTGSTTERWYCLVACAPSAAPTAPNWSHMASTMIDMMACYQCWISGNRMMNIDAWMMVLQWSANDVIKDNYLYNAWGVDPYGFRLITTGNLLIQNNIIDKVRSAGVIDSPDAGSVIAYNYVTNSNSGNTTMWQSFWQHAAWVPMQLYEGNVAYGWRTDWFHGTHAFATLYRNMWTGWESCANGQCNSGTAKAGQTLPLEFDSYGNRFGNVIANVLGTPGYHNNYQVQNNQSIYINGIGNFNRPTGIPMPASDPLVASTMLRWGNYDTVTAAANGGQGTRWCGNSSNTGWSSICGSTSEVPTGAAGYPNAIPTKGDTGPVQPPSFYLTSKPTWFGSTPFPAIGPDVTGGNVVQCSTSTSSAAGLNTVGQFNGIPVANSAQCTGSTAWAAAWGGHVNSIPAMNCALNTMGIPPDGTGGVKPFDASVCYAGGTPSVTNPSFAPGGGTYFGSTSVTISTIPGTAVICYTTDGSTPAASVAGICSHGTTYSGPVTVASSETLNAIGTQSGFLNSGVSSAIYTINGTVPVPTIAPGTGSYLNFVNVTLSDSLVTATICYTTNGSTPTANGAGVCTNGTPYTGVITITTTGTTLKAIASNSGFTDSGAASAVYTITIAAPSIGSVEIL